MKANKKILMLIGIPASGKSTWANDYVQKNEKWIKVSRDNFRDMFKSSRKLSPKEEKLISHSLDKSVEQGLKMGFNIIIDNTNLKLSHINEFVNKFKYYADIEFRVFDISLSKALERDNNREHKVGKEVINRMYNNYKILMDTFDFQTVYKANRTHVVPNESTLDSAVLFDIDGTLAIMKNRMAYDWNKVDNDDLNPYVLEAIEFHKNKGRKIILLSGRSEESRKLTEEWLSFYNVNYDSLLMRAKDDYRKDTIVKKEIYMNNIDGVYNTHCVYDDRLDVVKMWVDLGLFVFNVNQHMHDF